MKKYPRDALTVLWSVSGNDTIIVMGSIWLKTDNIAQKKKPRLVVEMHMAAELLSDITLDQLVPISEERLLLDLDELNGEGSFTAEDAMTPEVTAMRAALEAE